MSDEQTTDRIDLDGVKAFAAALSPWAHLEAVRHGWRPTLVGMTRLQ